MFISICATGHLNSSTVYGCTLKGLLGSGEPTVDDINPALRTLDYGNYGIFLIMGNAGFISSAIGEGFPQDPSRTCVKDGGSGLDLNPKP